MVHDSMLETVGTGFERLDGGLLIEGMDGRFQSMLMRLIYDRIENFTLESVDLDVDAQRFRPEKIWFSVLAPTLMNDLDRIHLLIRQAPHRGPCVKRRIGFDGCAPANPTIPSINGGCRMTAGSRERSSGCEQSGATDFATLKHGPNP